MKQASTNLAPSGVSMADLWKSAERSNKTPEYSVPERIVKPYDRENLLVRTIGSYSGKSGEVYGGRLDLGRGRRMMQDTYRVFGRDFYFSNVSYKQAETVNYN